VHAGNVVSLEAEAGTTFSLQQIEEALKQHKPAVLFLCQVPQLLSCSVFDPVTVCQHGAYRI
jgi:hypothetical protein